MIEALKHFIYIYILFFLFLEGFSQDPHFTQFYSNPLYLAPSFAGATEEFRVTSNYRNQWPSIPGGYETYSFSADHYFSNFNSGVGVLILRDDAGAGNLGLTSLGLQYSFDFMINKLWHIRPGLSFNYMMLGLDFNQLIFSSPTEISPGEIAGDVDFGSSVLVYDSRFWFGVGADHLLKPNLSFYEDQAVVPLKFSVFGGAQIIKQGRLLRPIDETISVAFLYRDQAKNKQLDLGLYWYKYPMVLGIWYRGIPPFNSNRGDALSLLTGFKTRNLSIGYSYDFTISNLISSVGGAHELSVVYEFKIKKGKRRIHAIPCPEF